MPKTSGRPSKVDSAPTTAQTFRGYAPSGVGGQSGNRSGNKVPQDGF
jgi:hypothetical protein